MEKLIKVCKKCNNTYVIDKFNVMSYKSVDSEQSLYCQRCGLTNRANVFGKKDWSHNPLK
jgi:RNase P subunit RPR2